jgi:hypothetical protein
MDTHMAGERDARLKKRILIQRSQFLEIQQQKVSKASCSKHSAKPEQCLRIIPMIPKR